MLYATKISRDILAAWANRIVRIARVLRWIRWKPPELGSLALNTDGAVKLSGLASAGGLVRDYRGSWIGGFVVNIGRTSVLQAQLVGIKEGLHLARRMGATRLEVGVDSSLSILLLGKDFSSLGHICRNLIMDCQSFLREFHHLSLQHICREANKCADSLENLGQSSSHGVTILENPPSLLRPLLVADSIGFEYLRF